jgi:four helix bundle protein
MADNLEDRLISFASLVIEICDNLKYSEAGKYLKSQILRSSTSVALNFGEARSSESPKDLHHKLSIILKELRETIINLKLMRNNSLCRKIELIEKAINENNQLIAIFITSIQTVRNKLNK